MYHGMLRGSRKKDARQIVVSLAGAYLCPPLIRVKITVHLSQLPQELVLVTVQLGNAETRRFEKTKWYR